MVPHTGVYLDKMYFTNICQIKKKIQSYMPKAAQNSQFVMFKN